MKTTDVDTVVRAIANDIPLKYFMGRDITKAYANMQHICEVIRQLPTVEAEPVRHSQWIYDGETGVWRCPDCGVTNVYPDKYCPKCKAKMDAEVEDGQG